MPRFRPSIIIRPYRIQTSVGEGTLNELCTQHAWLCMLVYAPGLIVELLTFFMLFGRLWLLFVGLVVIAMHALVEITMNLAFPQHQWIFFLYAVNLPFWIVRGIQSLALGLRRHPAKKCILDHTGS